MFCYYCGKKQDECACPPEKRGHLVSHPDMTEANKSPFDMTMKIYYCSKNQVHAALGNIEHEVLQYNPSPEDTTDPDYQWGSMWLDYKKSAYQEVRTRLDAASIEHE